MRYEKEIPDITPWKPVIEKIFQVIIRQEIALEINFSGVRKPLGTVIPVPQILRLYRECGGKLLTFGSDAHVTHDIGVGHAQAFDIVRACGFTRFHSNDNGVWQEHSLWGIEDDKLLFLFFVNILLDHQLINTYLLTKRRKRINLFSLFN